MIKDRNYDLFVRVWETSIPKTCITSETLCFLVDVRNKVCKLVFGSNYRKYLKEYLKGSGIN